MHICLPKKKRILNTNRTAVNVVAINGCCYGRDNSEDKGDYLKKCGQSFWKFISGDEDLFVRFVEPLGHRAKERNDEFALQYAQVVNRFAVEFASKFCNSNGAILWEKIVRLNSASINE